MSPQRIIDRYNVANVVPLSTTLRGGEEHAVIKSSKYTSIAMCEQLKSVDIGRLTEKLGEISEKELQAVEMSIKAAIGMFEEVKEGNNETLKIQLEKYKQLYDDLLEKVCQKN